jgi:hypothetical protein
MADEPASSEESVARWVRLGMVIVLAVPQLAIGLWAVLAPANWFEKFPGIDPRLVAAEPPFNAHLATDAGAGFLAIGIALAVAAAWGRRQAVQLASSPAWPSPSRAPSTTTNPAPGLTAGDDLLNVLVLASSPAWVAVFAWGTRRHRKLG